MAWRAKPPRWGDGAKLNLYSASVGVIQYQPDAWPEKLELSGFTYDRFGELGSDAPIAERDSEWFEKWLARNETYTPEPYHQCAKVLREMGHPEMADDVLYAGRERDRKEAWRSGRKLRAAGLLSLQLLIGYGYGRRLLWRPLRCALFLLLCGALLPDAVAFLAPDLLGDRVAWCAEVGRTGGGSVCLDQQPFIWRLMFSLDMLLPIVELSHEHTAVQAGLDGIGYAWFVVQRFLGWVIALFVIAGLTGLTK